MLIYFYFIHLKNKIIFVLAYNAIFAEVHKVKTQETAGTQITTIVESRGAQTFSQLYCEIFTYNNNPK